MIAPKHTAHVVKNWIHPPKFTELLIQVAVMTVEVITRMHEQQ